MINSPQKEKKIIENLTVVTTKFFDKFGGLMFMDCYFYINMSLETIHLGWKGLRLLWWLDVQG
jgi:hypothetical protein